MNRSLKIIFSIFAFGMASTVFSTPRIPIFTQKSAAVLNGYLRNQGLKDFLRITKFPKNLIGIFLKKSAVDFHIDMALARYSQILYMSSQASSPYDVYRHLQEMEKIRNKIEREIFKAAEYVKNK